MTEDNRIPRIRAVMADPMLDEAMMLDQVNAILDNASAPADEVQWSVKYPGSSEFTYRPTTDEDDARQERACRADSVLGKREVWYGPWIEIPVDLRAISATEWQSIADRATAARANTVNAFHDRPLVSEEGYVPCRFGDETCVGQVTADRLCDVHRLSDPGTGEA